jgi:hypothetical protein
MRRTLLTAVLCLGAVGCATTPNRSTPQAQLVESQAAIRAAEEVGAERIPEAERYLTFARQQMSDAERLLTENEYEAAELVLRQAEADAELAMALAREVPLRNDAQLLRQRVESLRQGQP